MRTVLQPAAAFLAPVLPPLGLLALVGVVASGQLWLVPDDRHDAVMLGAVAVLGLILTLALRLAVRWETNQIEDKTKAKFDEALQAHEEREEEARRKQLTTDEHRVLQMARDFASGDVQWRQALEEEVRRLSVSAEEVASRLAAIEADLRQNRDLAQLFRGGP